MVVLDPIENTFMNDLNVMIRWIMLCGPCWMQNPQWSEVLPLLKTISMSWPHLVNYNAFRITMKLEDIEIRYLVP